MFIYAIILPVMLSIYGEALKDGDIVYIKGSIPWW